MAMLSFDIPLAIGSIAYFSHSHFLLASNIYVIRVLEVLQLHKQVLHARRRPATTLHPKKVVHNFESSELEPIFCLASSADILLYHHHDIHTSESARQSFPGVESIDCWPP